jgi:hypothetical protein
MTYLLEDLTPNEDRPPEAHSAEAWKIREIRERTLDKTIADSFPASDPPSTNPAPDFDAFAA